MIQLTQNGLILPDTSELTRMQKEFSEKHCVVLPAFLDQKLVTSMVRKLDTSVFFENEHVDSQKEVFATDLTIQGKSIVLHQIHLLMNNIKLFNLIEELTQTKGIKGFAGRIYRNMPNTKHRLDWHDDTEDATRIIGLSINLNQHKYSGGVFQLSAKSGNGILAEVPCGNPGDMHIFRVSPKLQHRVTPTIGEFPRTAAAGWFTSEVYSLISI